MEGKNITGFDVLDAFESSGFANKGVEFGCCYCGNAIEIDKLKGVSIFNALTGVTEQCWFSHESCMRERLHPEFNIRPEDEVPEGHAGPGPPPEEGSPD